jgi:hypothetical protein
MNSQSYSHLDGNAAAGELNTIFAIDITGAEAQCAQCGTTRHFAENRWYVKCPGIVARCSECGHILLRLVNTGERLLLDCRGMGYLAFGRTETEIRGDN